MLQVPRDERLPASQRLKYHPDQATHISDHTLGLPKDDQVFCWMPGCTARRKWYPLQLADHFYAAHGISMCQKPEDAKDILISAHGNGPAEDEPRDSSAV